MSEVYLVCSVTPEGERAPMGVYTSPTLAKEKAEEIWSHGVEAIITAWFLNGTRGRFTWVRDDKGMRQY